MLLESNLQKRWDENTCWNHVPCSYFSVKCTTFASCAFPPPTCLWCRYCKVYLLFYPLPQVAMAKLKTILADTSIMSCALWPNMWNSQLTWGKSNSRCSPELSVSNGESSTGNNPSFYNERWTLHICVCLPL